MKDVLSRERQEFLLKSAMGLVEQVAGSFQRERLAIDEKGYKNYLTSADIEIEEKLIKGLKKLEPGFGFVAEEESKLATPGREYRWIIDPIDGTCNFLNGFPFAISLALQRFEGETALAIVYDVSEHTFYYGSRGGGSFVLTNGREPIGLRACANRKGGSVGIFGMPYDRQKTGKIFSIAEKFYEFCADLKRIGPASLDICRVACGKAEYYFELDLELWDIAAGLLILQEAGGNYVQYGDLSVFYGCKKPKEIILDP